MTDREIMQQALDALEKIAAYRPLTFAECSDAEAVMGIAENAIPFLRERLAQPEQEFIKHHGDDEGWSEWVCPDPKDYLMKCCDCGLVHEAQFRVVRYKSKTELEDCDMVSDFNLQAVFRMRRSEQWSPVDTAHRAGGMPMAQPEQEPVALEAAPLSDYSKADGDFYKWWYSHMQNDLMQPPLNEVGYRVARYIWDAALRERLAQPEHKPMHPTLQKMWEDYFDKCYKRKPEQEPVAWEDVLGAIARGWTHDDNKHKTMDVRLAVAIAKEIQDMVIAPLQRKPLTDEEMFKIWVRVPAETEDRFAFARAIEAAHGIKENT